MHINDLAGQLGMDVNDLLAKASKLNSEYELKIKDFAHLSRIQYDLIRCALDTKYMVKLIRGGSHGGKYNYESTPSYLDLEKWITENNLNGKGTLEIQEMLPDFITHRGSQTIAAAMKANDYYNRVVMLDSGKQGRRWFKDEMWKDEPSFM